jgi:hypothetical protein
MKMTVFWDVHLHGLVDMYLCLYPRGLALCKGPNRVSSVILILPDDVSISVLEDKSLFNPKDMTQCFTILLLPDKDSSASFQNTACLTQVSNITV